MMSKEIKHDRCDFFGLGVNEHCSTHSGEYTATRNSLSSRLLLLGLLVAIICAGTPGTQGQSGDSSSGQGAAGEPYPNMPSIAPIGVRIAKYMDVPAPSQ